MQLSQKGIDLICSFEGFRSEPYLDSVNVPTIGYGTTLYKSGKKVTMDDSPISQPQAVAELVYHIENRCYHALIGLSITQNQFDALCSFIYNVGTGNFSNSTLRKLIVANPKDPNIKAEFLKWNKAGGKVLAGLTKRREAESELYFAQ